MKFRTRGGKRPGAGRKPRYGKAGVPHRARPLIRRRTPVHLTLRMRREVWNLRSRRCYAAIQVAFWGGKERFGFRLIDYSVQGNHIHLIVEVETTVAMTQGTQGLAIRIGLRLNRVMGRRGKVVADRYHAHVLRTPSEVRRAINYVLQNARRHYGLACDDYSTDPTFVVAPRTWLAMGIALAGTFLLWTIEASVYWTVARAIDSSTSAGNVACRRSCASVSSFSASMQTRPIAATVSTGYFPVAVSAESITASVPSSTALATSAGMPMRRSGVVSGL